jgi:hypothetical protein
MILLRHPGQLAAAYENGTTAAVIASLASLLQQRFADLAAGTPYDPDAHGYLVLVEPMDTAQALETETGCPLLSDWAGRRYGEAGFAPACEWLDEQLLYYEMGYVLNDGGAALLLIVPKLSGIDEQLVSLCRQAGG